MLPPAAVARKLGLAPQRTSLDARLSKLARGPGMATPPRTSIDGILAALQMQQQQQQQQQGSGSNRSSLDQQAATAMLQAMGNNPQLAHMAGLNGLQPGLNSYGGASAPAYPPANSYGSGPPGGEGMGLHPALLSLVAAQMQGGGPAPPTGVPAGGMHSGLGSQHGSDANMAVLVDSLNSWQLGGPGGAGPASLGHRGSMDGMTGMAGAPVRIRCRAGLCGVHWPRAGWGRLAGGLGPHGLRQRQGSSCGGCVTHSADPSHSSWCLPTPSLPAAGHARCAIGRRLWRPCVLRWQGDGQRCAVIPASMAVCCCLFVLTAVAWMQRSTGTPCRPTSAPLGRCTDWCVHCPWLLHLQAIWGNGSNEALNNASGSDS